MLSEDLIGKIGSALEEMPPKPASRREIERLLVKIEAQIRSAQERGCTYADIAKQMTASGYAIKTSTLRVALQRLRKVDPRRVKVPSRQNTLKKSKEG